MKNLGERAYDSQLFVTFDGEELEQPTLIPVSRTLATHICHVSADF